MAENENHDREMVNQNRTLRDYLQPVRTGTPSCIIQPLNANNFNFKPGIIPLIPHFHGMDSENPYLYIKEFEEVCSIFMDRTCTEEVIRLKLFPFSLKDKAKTWLNSLRPSTIGTWSRQVESTHGKYTVNEDDDLRAKLTLLSRKVEAMELKKVKEVHAVPKFSEKCGICEDHGHSTNECPMIPAFKEVLLDQSNAVNMIHKPYSGPNSNSYNPGWRSHPNFSWRGDQHVAPATLAPGPSQLAI
ncbi:uncharacterized protein LOC122293473 [Carya illinoinensis]|uniref:uncharacterized protein LOC122293473 n=1 Tax=Carya illinoinensis TaxID=32201 RepID=UPI001C7183F1|nr:uncharacterized protein LOC122293473 [Carya illinoinensis]